MKIDNKKSEALDNFQKNLQEIITQYHRNFLSDSIKRGLKAKKEREMRDTKN